MNSSFTTGAGPGGKSDRPPGAADRGEKKTMESVVAGGERVQGREEGKEIEE